MINKIIVTIFYKLYNKSCVLQQNIIYKYIFKNRTSMYIFSIKCKPYYFHKLHIIYIDLSKC